MGTEIAKEKMKREPNYILDVEDRFIEKEPPKEEGNSDTKNESKTTAQPKQSFSFCKGVGCTGR